MRELNILVAPNAFKSAASAFEVANAVEAGLSKSRLSASVVCRPIADGGDGTLPILVNALNGTVVQKEVAGPLQQKITAPFGFVKDKALAIIEMADASGLRLISPSERNALGATSSGTGELIKEAMALGAKHIILCIGGSATTDGGMGILSALGFQFRDSDGKVLVGSGEMLGSIATVLEPEASYPLQITVLCDVNNTLLGPGGAAAVYGPQKGASQQEVELLEQGLQHWAALIKQNKGVDVSELKGGGAAGGVSAGLVGWMNAELQPGASYVLQLLEMEQAIRSADLVITAEGSLDEQTMEGKGPFALLELAEKNRKPVIGLAGRISREIPEGGLNRFQALFPIGSQPESLEQAMENTLVNIERTAYNLGNLLAVGKLQAF
jgi:glycerate 2-kinase